MRAAHLLVAFLALAAAVSGPSPVAAAPPSDKDIQDVLMRFIGELSGSFRDGGAAKRRLLSVGQDIHSFFSNMLGSKWADIVPASWSAPSFDWAKLGEFEYNSNLAEFLDAADLQSLGEIGSLKDLNESVAAIEAAFCEPESHEKGEKKAAECTGPTVSIELAPKVCILDAKAKEVVCDPAKLILKKTPGSCTHKYTSAFVWTGKECKLSGGAGFAEEKVVGGGNKIIPLKDLTIEYEP